MMGSVFAFIGIPTGIACAVFGWIAGAAARGGWEPPKAAQWQGELVKVLPWCNLEAGQPRVGDWCNVQGDAFPLVDGIQIPIRWQCRMGRHAVSVWCDLLRDLGIRCVHLRQFGRL
jgi:hypothetical protein